MDLWPKWRRREIIKRIFCAYKKGVFEVIIDSCYPFWLIDINQNNQWNSQSIAHI
jgi:hypothetical protein